MKGWHMLLCLGLVAVGVVLALTGSAYFLVPAIGCALMMGGMMWMMRSSGGS